MIPNRLKQNLNFQIGFKTLIVTCIALLNHKIISKFNKIMNQKGAAPNCSFQSEPSTL